MGALKLRVAGEGLVIGIFGDLVVTAERIAKQIQLRLLLGAGAATAAYAGVIEPPSAWAGAAARAVANRMQAKRGDRMDFLGRSLSDTPHPVNWRLHRLLIPRGRNAAQNV